MRCGGKPHCHWSCVDVVLAMASRIAAQAREPRGQQSEGL